MSSIERSDLEELPRWAIVCLAARCARRVTPVIGMNKSEDQTLALQVLNQIEDSCRRGRGATESEIFAMIDDVDDAEVSCRGSREENARVAGRALLAVKLAAFCAIEDSDRFVQNATQCLSNCESAGCCGVTDDPDEAITNHAITLERMKADFEHISRLTDEQDWNDQSAVDINLIGEMWPATTPTWATGNSKWDAIH